MMRNDVDASPGALIAGGLATLTDTDISLPVLLT
jgi:hypothetical protein